MAEAAFLQQLSIPPLFLPMPHGRQQVSVAIHRRLKSVLSFDQPDCRYDVFQAGGIDVDAKWGKNGSFYLPDTLKTAKVVVCLTLESLDAFLVVLLKDGSTYVVFLDARTCDFMAMSELSSDLLPICADIDQAKRELHMGFTKGVLVSFSLRVAPPTKQLSAKQAALQPPSSGGGAAKKVIQTISRKQTKIRSLLASMGGGDKFTFHQITHSDVINVALILSEQGSISCVESTDHEVLWVVRRDSFIKHPVWLWMDKFGTDFCVLCLDADDPTNVDEETLEYWRPPIDHASMQGGEFQRVQLPKTDILVGLAMETLHPGLDPIIMTVTVNDHVQLFRCDEKQGSVALATEFFLTGGSTSSLLKLKRKSPKKGKNKGSSSVRVEEQEGATSAFPPRFAGVATFVAGTGALPDCTAVLLSSCYSSITAVGIHLPSPADYAYQKTCLFVAASQVEAAEVPELAMEQEMRNIDELGAFMLRSSAPQAHARVPGGAGPGAPGAPHPPPDALLQPLGPPGAGVDSGPPALTMSLVSDVSKMGFMSGGNAVNSSEALMSAALLDADKEIESLHSDHPPSWLARASVSVEGGSGSVHSLGYPGSPGSAVTGPGGPAGGRPGLGLDSRSYVSHTSHNTNPNFPLGANASTMSFGGDVDDDLDDDHHRGGGDKHDKDKT